MILIRHLCILEGKRKFRPEQRKFVSCVSMKRRDYHLRLCFFGVPALKKQGWYVKVSQKVYDYGSLADQGQTKESSVMWQVS